MKLTQMFEDVKKQWPQEIKIDDCQLYEDGRLLCTTLSQIWDEVETHCERGPYGDWGGLMTWGIFCGLHEYIRDLPQPYPEKIHIDNMDYAYAVEKINESIYSESSDYNIKETNYENDLHLLLEHHSKNAQTKISK